MRHRMAGLTRTVDDDDSVSDDGDIGPLFAKQRGGFGFNDLDSDEGGEEDGRGKAGTSWNFDAHSIETATNEQATTLEDKIRQRLLEKGEVVDDASAGKKKKKKKPKKEESANVSKLTDADTHLKTGIHFSDLQLSRPLLRAVAELKFESPTPIQRDVIPPALRGLDVLATAETGSGKTASFLLPALERLCQSPSVRTRRRDPNTGRVLMGQVATKAMVLIPTRELAVQCHAMCQDLAKYTMVSFQLVAGGFVARDQAVSLRSQPDVVIATPGRMLDHLLNSASVHMELLEIVIFDEADRLLEMGFREECTQVLKRCSKGRQTMLFSATMNSSVEDLASLALVRPVRVHANPVNRVAETLEQEFVKVPSQALRESVLLSLCTRNYTSRVIIFCATKQTAHRLAIIFGLCGLSFAQIHGNLAQQDRVEGLQRFQAQEVDFLLATDLASRGLDLQNVSTVINFDLPTDVTRYIHRVGRTARMGRCGRAVTVYVPEEYSKVKALGKQVCHKVKSKVLKRTVASEAVKEWADKISSLEEDIASIKEDEGLEKEFRLADMLSGKSENIVKHKEDIHSRPAKTWYITNKEKSKLRVEDAERVAKAADEIGAPQAQPSAPSAASEKRQRPEDEDEEVREAKRKKKARERFLKQKAEEKEERAKDMKRIMTKARRSKKADRAVQTETGMNSNMQRVLKNKGKKKNKRK